MARHWFTYPMQIGPTTNFGDVYTATDLPGIRVQTGDTLVRSIFSWQFWTDNITDTDMKPPPPFAISFDVRPVEESSPGPSAPWESGDVLYVEHLAWDLTTLYVGSDFFGFYRSGSGGYARESKGQRLIVDHSSTELTLTLERGTDTGVFDPTLFSDVQVTGTVLWHVLWDLKGE